MGTTTDDYPATGPQIPVRVVGNIQFLPEARTFSQCADSQSLPVPNLNKNGRFV